MGRPDEVKPHGTLIAGRPVELLGLVFLDTLPEPGPRTGCVVVPMTTVLSAIRGAGMGAVGVTSTSTSLSTRTCSSLIRR